MKITNWRKKLAAAIAAAGISIPGLAGAVSIPVLDSNFTDYTVPGSGFAYANLYRPISAWVDDLEHNSGDYFQDNSSSNWLYNGAYSDLAGSTGHYRGAPRSGGNDQALHGLFRYSAQELTATFQADTLYTFSAYAQGDADADYNDTYADSVYLYLFNADGVAFTEFDSLKYKGFRGGPSIGGLYSFLNRAGANHADSINNWTQVSINYFVPALSPLIGKRIGVGLYIGGDAAVDDVSLSAVPEPGTIILVGIGGVSLLALGRRRK